jgi:GNAT superfamily N-acetyltransferase
MAMIAIDGQEVITREIAMEDAEAVAELSGQLGYETSTQKVKERIATMLPLEKDHLALVAVVRGEVAGWIEAEIARHLQSEPHAVITGLVIRDGYRSLGIGSRLCAQVEDWGQQRGISIIRVTSRMTREQAHRFYLREGFVQVKTSAVFEKILSSETE